MTIPRDALQTALRSYRDELEGNRLEEAQATAYLETVRKRRVALETLIEQTEAALCQPVGKED